MQKIQSSLTHGDTQSDESHTEGGRGGGVNVTSLTQFAKKLGVQWSLTSARAGATRNSGYFGKLSRAAALGRWLILDASLLRLYVYLTGLVFGSGGGTP